MPVGMEELAARFRLPTAGPLAVMDIASLLAGILSQIVDVV
jgi:hypothetical protein